MRVWIAAAAIVGTSLWLVGSAAAAPPGNDTFADAVQVSSLPFSDTVDLTDATTEASEPAGCYGPGQTAWWSFTPTADTVVRADTFGSSIPGSYVNLWEATGTGFAGLSLRDCVGYWGFLTEKLEAGVTYYLQAGSFYGFLSGSVALNVQVEPPPAFDQLGSATSIASVSYSQSSVDSSYATSSPDDPDCFGTGSTVWYTYLPSEDMRLEASVQEQYPDSPSRFTLAAYSGEPGAPTELDCSDDSLVVQGFRKPHIEFDAEAGVPVHFMIGTSGGTDGGIFHFSLQRPLVVQATVDARGAVSKAGAATVSGSISCSRPTGSTINLSLRQIFAGRLTAFGSAAVSTACSPSSTSWSAELSSFPVSFGPGVGDVELQTPSICDSQGCQPGALYDESSYNRLTVTRVRLRSTR